MDRNETTFNNQENITAIQGNIHNYGSINLRFPNDEHLREDLKAKERRILRILDKSPYQDRKDRNPDRINGTCEWFVGHGLFKEWQENKSSRTLWVSADPGCGKSVLAKYLVDSVLPTTDSRTTCYFFFKDDFEDQRSVITALCCILRQIFIQKRILLSETILEQFEITRDPEGFTNSFSGLWDALISTANDMNAGQIVCILDAFDECESKGRSQLAQALCKIYSTKGDTNSNLKFLLTSRPYGGIRRGFQTQFLGIPGLSVIHLSGESEAEMTKISDEIGIFIKARVQDIGARLRFKPEEEDFLLKKLLRVPNRTYLWAYLVLDLIKDDIYIDKNGIIKATSHLPKTVDEVYEKILSKSDNVEETKRLLHIVVAAARPLTLKEMNLALALKKDRKGNHQSGTCSSFYFESEERFREIVRDLCGLFVTVINSRIYLLHQTAKEFLVQNDLTSPPKSIDGEFKWRHSLKLPESHQVLGRICIQYLLSPELKTPPLDEDALSEYTESHVFLDYSAKHWTTHVLESRVKFNTATARSILKLCNPHSKNCLTWLTVYWASQNTDFPDSITSFIIASYFGFTEVMETLLGLDGLILDSRYGTHRRSALSWAAGNGHDSAVGLLISMNWPWWGMGLLHWEKVQIDSVDTYGRTPLSYAVWNRHVAVIKLLLDAGARVDLKDNVGGTPLSYAICGGNEEVVRLILKNGTNVDSKEGIIQDLIVSSIKKDDMNVVKLLLDTGIVGIDPGLEDTSRVNLPLLFLAIEYGSLAVVQLLLARGAKANHRYSIIHEMTPLLHAVQKDDDTIVAVLLENGAQADLDLEDENGWRPLSHAVGQGNAIIVQHLIAAGAKTKFKYEGLDGLVETPLLRAIKNNADTIVELLLKNGALPEPGDENESIQFPPIWPITEIDGNSFHWVDNAPCGCHFIWKDSLNGELTEIRLKEYFKAGEKINGRGPPPQYTPLMAAVSQGHQEVVKILLKNGANVNSRADDGSTALWLATSSAGRYSEAIIVELLHKRPDLNVVPKQGLGNTPLMQAITQLRNPRVVSMLVGNGADATIENYQGKTAMELVVEQPNSAELLTALMPSFYQTRHRRGQRLT